MNKINDLGYDYVLIDSRTGLNDQAGIATQILPDLIVMVFRLTEQNLDVLSHLYETTEEQLRFRGKGNVKVFPVASFVTSDSSKKTESLRKSACRIFDQKSLEYIRFDANPVSYTHLTLPTKA